MIYGGRHPTAPVFTDSVFAVLRFWEFATVGINQCDSRRKGRAMLHEEARPLALVVTDSLGDTAFAVLRAALAQFKHGS